MEGRSVKIECTRATLTRIVLWPFFKVAYTSRSSKANLLTQPPPHLNQIFRLDDPSCSNASPNTHSS